MSDGRSADSADVGGDVPRARRLDSSAVMLAHDLRNPLVVARGRLELASEDPSREHLDAAMRAHERIDEIIEDYLALAREGSMVVEPGPVDLAAVARESWEHVPTDDATLSIETGRVIYADEERVRRLLENLARNAVEHGGSDVTVTVGDLDDGFFVADDGPGIPPAERASVLDVGYSSVSDNTGVGLAIVATIVEAHGWELAVTDGDGARFEITGVEFAS